MNDFYDTATSSESNVYLNKKWINIVGINIITDVIFIKNYDVVMGCYRPILKENYKLVNFKTNKLPITNPNVWPIACIKLAIWGTFNYLIDNPSRAISWNAPASTIKKKNPANFLAY
jgi:hypothetical protein